MDLRQEARWRPPRTRRSRPRWRRAGSPARRRSGSRSRLTPRPAEPGQPQQSAATSPGPASGDPHRPAQERAVRPGRARETILDRVREEAGTATGRTRSPWPSRSASRCRRPRHRPRSSAGTSRCCRGQRPRHAPGQGRRSDPRSRAGTRRTPAAGGRPGRRESRAAGRPEAASRTCGARGDRWSRRGPGEQAHPRRAAIPSRTSRSGRPDQRARSRSVAGAMAPEVAGGELSQGLVAAQPPRRRHPLREQDEGLLPPSDRPQHDQPGLGEVPEQVVSALALDRTPPAAIAASSASRFRARPPSQRRDRRIPGSCDVPGVMPSSARREAVDRITRDAISPSIQPMSSAAVTCRVPRIGQDLTMSPASNAAADVIVGQPDVRGGRWTTGRRGGPAPGSPAWSGRPHRASSALPTVMRWAARRIVASRRRSVVNAGGSHAPLSDSPRDPDWRTPVGPRGGGPPPLAAGSGGAQNRTNASRSTRGRVWVPTTSIDTWWVAEEDHVFAYTSTRSARLAARVSTVFTSRPSR